MSAPVIDPASIVGPLDEAVLEKFTAALRRAGGRFRNFRFDPSYVEFLRRTNGGIPDRNVFDTALVQGRVVERFLHMCDLPQGHPLGASSVPVSFFLTEERLHDRLVPFAGMFGGNMLCFDYGDLRKGRPAVVVWMHDDCFEDHFAVDFVADNFDEFLTTLRAVEKYSRQTVASWHESGTMPIERIRAAMDIDPASILGPVNEGHLTKFEHVLCEYKELLNGDVDLDPSFVAFLRTCNGGTPRRSMLSVPRVGMVRIVQFAHMAAYEWDDPRGDSDVWSLWSATKHGIAKGLLPFAACDGNRVLCFDYSRLTDKRPAIVLSETTGNQDCEIEDRGANYPVAENFDALLDMKWS